MLPGRVKEAGRAIEMIGEKTDADPGVGRVVSAGVGLGVGPGVGQGAARGPGREIDVDAVGPTGGAPVGATGLGPHPEGEAPGIIASLAGSHQRGAKEQDKVAPERRLGPHREGRQS